VGDSKTVEKVMAFLDRLVWGGEGKKVVSYLAHISWFGVYFESNKQIHSLVCFKMAVEIQYRPIVCRMTGGVEIPVVSSLVFGGQ